MSKKSDSIMNYFLSIGFVLFLIIFLSLMVLMSRYVLSDVTPIGEHVQSTQDLLEDIEEVTKVAELNIDNKSVMVIPPRESYSSFNELGVDISKVHYFNSVEGNSIISITFSGEVGTEEGVYFLKTLPVNLEKGDLIAYKINGLLRTGNFVVFLENRDEIHISEKGELMKIKDKQLLGKVFFIEANEEEN